MRLFRIAIFPFAVCAATHSLAQASKGPETFEIAIRYETRSEGSGMSGSSRGGYLYREQIFASEGACRLRRFDVIDDPESPRPLALWEMPVEVRECEGQPAEIANREAMLERLNAFLSAAELPREACGRHYFTWNVFRIECDPDFALETVKRIDLGSLTIEDGAPFFVHDTGTRVKLKLVESRDQGLRRFIGSGAIDPKTLREQTAKTIMVVAEVSGEEVSHEGAMAQIAEHRFSGEVSVTIVEDPVEERITLTVISETAETDAEGQTETRWREEITTREKVGTAPGPDPSG